MNRNLRTFVLPVMLFLAASACTWFTTTQPTPAANSLISINQSSLPSVELSVQAEPPAPLNTVGQVVQYKYTLRNNGSVPILGAVTFSGATVTCPSVTTIGNLDGNLDANETLACTSSYAVTQADLDKGSLTSVTSASVNDTVSNQVTTTVATVQTVSLSLIKTATPPGYDHVGQVITYTYQIKNIGSANLGPAQFMISDSGLGAAPFNCGAANTTLAPNATVSCSASYTITQADLNAATVSTNATASGSGISQPAGATLTKIAGGATVQHTVAAGEWLWQIARCYGTDPHAIGKANPQLSNTSMITPGTIVNVPNVGSAGPVFGPPCVMTYTVLAGDTWSSIAQKYGTDVAILQRANPGGMAVGRKIIVPRNGFTTP